MTWQESAAARIEEIGKTFPADMPLKEMRQILSAAGADFAGGTSWPHKAWRKAQRAYLERRGQPKGYGKRKAEAPLFEPAQPTPAQMDAFERGQS